MDLLIFVGEEHCVEREGDVDRELWLCSVIRIESLVNSLVVSNSITEIGRIREESRTLV